MLLLIATRDCPEPSGRRDAPPKCSPSWPKQWPAPTRRPVVSLECGPSHCPGPRHSPTGKARLSPTLQASAPPSTALELVVGPARWSGRLEPPFKGSLKGQACPLGNCGAEVVSLGGGW